VTDASPFATTPAHLREQLLEIQRLTEQLGRPVTYMEVCGTHTMSAFRSGLRSLLPASLSLLSGPGCPVCVTPAEYVDQAVALARRPDTLIVTFGDLLRVPGSHSTLERERALGADIRVAYSPLEALSWAAQEPDRQVVFLAVGFETTIPAVAVAVQQSAERQLRNLTFLCALKLMPPALNALLASPQLHLDGLLCPGHVSVIIGPEAYASLAQHYHLPCVVAGFEPADMVAGLLMLLRQTGDHRAEVEVQYRRSVRPGGQKHARQVWESVFQLEVARWRGLGQIPDSGLRLRPEYATWDTNALFPEAQVPEVPDHPGCHCGQVLQGLESPPQCPQFAKGCTPESPYGPCMVSSEGTCAAFYRYRDHRSHSPRVPASGN
jgi:hydrogenase expression/formation protein HypD